MTRLGYLLFNVMLVAMIYGLAHHYGAQGPAYMYSYTYFSKPYIVLNLLFAIAATIRGIWSGNQLWMKEAVTFWQATVISLVATALALVMTGAIPHEFWVHLFTV